MYTTLSNALTNSSGALIGRNGSIELAAILAPNNIRPDILERHTGVWPKQEILPWRSAYISAIQNCDVIAAGWYSPLIEHEKKLLEAINPLVTKIQLRDLEPYYMIEPRQRWTTLLSGKRVTVVNAFTKTMQSQLLKRTAIWGEKNVHSLLPESTIFSFVHTGYAPALTSTSDSSRWPNDIDSWRAAVNYVVEKVTSTAPDVVLIGCGGLGMIIGDELKKRGIIAIIMGGAVQVLFGIKGNRWAHHDVISGFWNEHWVYPSDEETPSGSRQIEGACYWK